MNQVPEPSRSKLPLGGVLILAITGGAILLFTAGGDSGWNPLSGPTSNAQAMQLSGQWLGIRLASADTPSAQSFGVAPATEGVVVAEFVMPEGARAQQAGLLPGDVLVGIDGNAISNLTQLYTLSTTLDVNRMLALSVTRQGQPLNLLVPGLPGGAMAGSMNPMAVNPAMMNPAIGSLVPGVPNVMAPALGAAPVPANGAVNGPMYFCPNDRLYWNQAQIGPSHTCPRCGGHLAP